MGSWGMRGCQDATIRMQLSSSLGRELDLRWEQTSRKARELTCVSPLSVSLDHRICVGQDTEGNAGLSLTVHVSSKVNVWVFVCGYLGLLVQLESIDECTSVCLFLVSCV